MTRLIQIILIIYETRKDWDIREWKVVETFENIVMLRRISGIFKIIFIIIIVEFCLWCSRHSPRFPVFISSFTSPYFLVFPFKSRNNFILLLPRPGTPYVNINMRIFLNSFSFGCFRSLRLSLKNCNQDEYFPHLIFWGLHHYFTISVYFTFFWISLQYHISKHSRYSFFFFFRSVHVSDPYKVLMKSLTTFLKNYTFIFLFSWWILCWPLRYVTLFPSCYWPKDFKVII